MAARSLSSAMPDFPRRNVSFLVFVSLEPDRWRDRAVSPLREANAPEHFIELEKLAFLPSFPTDRNRYFQTLYERRALLRSQRRFQEADALLPERVGLQPYVTAEVYGRLVLAWQQYHLALAAGDSPAAAQQTVLFYMGWLAHYVADGSQPLHTTQHFDGWTGPNPQGYATGPGLHSKVEDGFLQRSRLEETLRTRTVRPRPLENPFSDYVSYLRASHAKVPQLYEIEKAGGFDGGGNPASREFISERLTAAAEMLASLWETAYRQGAASR